MTHPDILAENEACAKIAEEIYQDEKEWSDSHAAVARVILERIRLRYADETGSEAAPALGAETE